MATKKSEEVIEETVDTAEAAVSEKKTKSVQSAEMVRRELVKAYKAEDKMTVNISPMYRPYFGNTMSVSVNGITVFIPCDGKSYEINRTHAIEAMSRVRKVDDMLTRKQQMTDIANNVESSPGDIKFY